MKKLAIIGTVVAIGALGIVGTAVAKPTGMTPAEYHALIVRSQAMNEKYGLGQQSQQAVLRGKLQEIGAWAVPSTTEQEPLGPVGMTPAEYRALMLRSEGLNQKYGLGVESLTLERGSNERFVAGNPARDALVTSSPSATSPDFAWGDASIAAGVLLAVLALTATGIVGLRHHGRLGTS